MEEKLQALLRKRAVPEETIKKMVDDKVDTFVLQVISDENLRDYLPYTGDRIAVKDFVNAKKEDKTKDRRSSLLQSLRKKLLMKKGKDPSDSDDDNPPKTKALRGNTNAKKSTRKVELGWLNFDFSANTYKQVRKKGGGSTRKVDISKHATKPDIEEAAKSFFFPGGKSKLGKLDSFTFDVMDFSEDIMNTHETVGEMYDRTGMNILRFYLASKMTDEKNEDNVNITPPEQEDLSGETTSETSTASAVASCSFNITETESAFETITDSTGTEGASNLLFLDESETEIFFKIPDDVEPANEISVPYSPGSASQIMPLEMTIHRGPMAFLELIGYFKDPYILHRPLSVTRILPNGDKEMAEDTGGVLRDLLTEFWKAFYDKCTVGRDIKVPSLRHDFGAEEWKSVGRVLAFGYMNTGYWPIQISQAFIRQSMFSTMEAEEPYMMSDFYSYISIPEKEIFQKATEDFAAADTEELLDALENHDCRSVVTAENCKAVLREIAHKEILQIPMFISKCWKEVFMSQHISTDKLQEIYTTIVPTNKSVLKMLQFPESLDTQALGVSKLIKRYVRELDPTKLSHFLRFCTGSDLITVPNISVEFADMRGLKRSPIARTCGCSLLLARNYENYMEFRSEFDNVLESNVWVMDIV